MTSVRSVFALLLPLVLFGCAFGSGETVQRYVLPAPQVEASKAPLPLNVQVLPVDVAAGLDTARIAVLESGARMNYLEGARWAEPLPDMLQDMWIDALRKSRLARSASNDFSAIKADRILHITANAFQAERENGDMNVTVDYAVKVIAPDTHAVLAVEELRLFKRAPASDTDSLMRTFVEVNADAMRGLIQKLANDIK